MIRWSIIAILTLCMMLTAGLWIVSYDPGQRRSLVMSDSFQATVDHDLFGPTNQITTFSLGANNVVVTYTAQGATRVIFQELVRSGQEIEPWSTTIGPILLKKSRFGPTRRSCGHGRRNSDSVLYRLTTMPSAKYELKTPLWIPTTIFGLYPAWALLAFVRRRNRLARGDLCRQCGYNLTGNISGVCPECGTQFDGTDSSVG